MHIHKSKWLFVCLVFSLSFASCKQKKSEEKPLAKVFDDYLYKSDLVSILPKNLSKTDSINIVKAYIQNWLIQSLLEHKAKENLSADKQNFDKQIEDYKRSLIIYAYQKEYLNQTSAQDTTVNDSDIESYYNENKASLSYETVMLKYNYIFIKKKAKNLVPIWTIFNKHDSISQAKLNVMCKESADKFSLSQEWISLSDLNKIVPTKISNPENFLKTNKTIEVSDPTNYYLINIFNYSLPNNPAPLELVKDKIKAIIINKRRQIRIKNMEESIYSNAKSQNNIKIY